ncbi:lipoate--protein ligase family protein [bacterium]|nr:lipoate--protein ligase family protein [bacterium]
METWYRTNDPPRSGPENMAWDEALLRTAADRGRPLLRMYAWREPAVSIGYFMKYPEHLADRYTIVRRPTGGGIVYHDADTTYTVVVPPDHPLHRLPTTEAYCTLHRAVAAALAPETELAAHQSTSLRGTYECFAKPVAGDVMAGNRKLAGAAQRRNRLGLLHQGSIAGHVTAARLVRAFRAVLAVGFKAYQLTTVEAALAGSLAREKYATASWNRRFT